MMKLVEPSFVTVSDAAIQFSEFRLVFCCNVKPVEPDGHDTIAAVVPVRVIDSNGAPGVCTTESRLQNLPVIEKPPPVIE